MLTQVAEV